VRGGTHSSLVSVSSLEWRSFSRKRMVRARGLLLGRPTLDFQRQTCFTYGYFWVGDECDVIVS
jgi:hypothetical protein